ncbi:MAG: DUF192 domain-containing protein [Candidatus Anstonellaceae archaeon]
MGTLIISNLSKKIKIDVGGEICNNIFSRAVGLMFRKNPTNLFFVFEEFDYHPIHSFFVNFKFDAIYLDKNLRVVEIFRNIAKDKTIFPKNKNSYLLELVPNITKKLKIALGDKLKVVVKK